MKILLISSVLLLSFNTFAQRNPFKNLSENQGKIGIGTDKPDELLTVKGKIHTQEVMVDLQGAVAPDYVFENYFEGSNTEGYTMLTLNELEAFLKENHHLPKVPSAEEIQKESLKLKEMNLLLLEKIEELTLYTIEQQKQIEALQEKVSQLED